MSNRNRKRLESDRINSTSNYLPESDIPSSPGFLSEVDLSRFNSYPNIYSVPGGANIIIDKLHEESLLGRGKGTRLSTRKSDTRRHCESGNSTGKFY